MHRDAGLHGGVDEDVGDALEPGDRVLKGDKSFIQNTSKMISTCHLNFGGRGNRLGDIYGFIVHSEAVGCYIDFLW